jgi:hypothetical protein
MSPEVAETPYDLLQARLGEFPSDYSRIGASIGTAQTINPLCLFEESRNIPQVPIWRMQRETKRFHFRRPITVRIYQEGDFYFATNDNLIITGTGTNPEEAFQDFISHVFHFIEYYKKIDRKQLMGDALRLKDLFSSLIVDQ